MLGYGLAAKLHDAQGPRDEEECSHCEGSRKLEAVTVRDVGGDVEDWPQELEPQTVDCFWCLPEYRGAK